MVFFFIYFVFPPKFSQTIFTVLCVANAIILQSVFTYKKRKHTHTYTHTLPYTHSFSLTLLLNRAHISTLAFSLAHIHAYGEGSCTHTHTQQWKCCLKQMQLMRVINTMQSCMEATKCERERMRGRVQGVSAFIKCVDWQQLIGCCV